MADVATFVTTAVYSGARASEILGLRWRDIDTTGPISLRLQLGPKGQLVPLKTKGSVRTIHMAPALAATIKAHKMASRFKADDAFVFTTDTGKPVGYRNAARAFDQAVTRAKLKDGEGRLSLHSLRHTAASALIASGEDVVRVSRFLGHSKVSVTLDLYASEFEKRDGANLGTALGDAYAAQ